MSWVDVLALREDEKVVDSWQGIREVIGKTFEVTLDGAKKERRKVATRERKEGLLILTNQRLLFLEGWEPYGNKLGESVKMSLIDVDKLWFKKAPLKTLDEPKGFETHVFTLRRVGNKKDFEKFKKLVEEYCERRRQELEKKQTRAIRFKV